MSRFEYDVVDNSYQVKGDRDGRYMVYSLDSIEQKMRDSEIERLVREHKINQACRQDLDYAEQCLNQMIFGVSTTLIDRMLLNCAIELFIRCFRSGNGYGRSQLSETTVFKKHATSMGEQNFLPIFQQFLDIRNRAIAHDQEVYKLNKIGVTVDTQTGAVVDIAEYTVNEGFLYSQNVDLLRKLINITQSYLTDQLDYCDQKIMQYFTEGRILVKNLESFDCGDIPLRTQW